MNVECVYRSAASGPPSKLPSFRNILIQRLEYDVSDIQQKLVGLESLLKLVCRRSKDPWVGLDHSFPPEAQDHPIIYPNSKDAVREGSELALVSTISNAANVTLRFPDFFHAELEQPHVPFTLGSAPNIVIEKEVMLKYSFFEL